VRGSVGAASRGCLLGRWDRVRDVLVVRVVEATRDMSLRPIGRVEEVEVVEVEVVEMEMRFMAKAGMRDQKSEDSAQGGRRSRIMADMGLDTRSTSFSVSFCVFSSVDVTGSLVVS
jgi:hypothetical protein